VNKYFIMGLEYLVQMEKMVLCVACGAQGINKSTTNSKGEKEPDNQDLSHKRAF
jgi:hypothetical protein